MLTPDPRYPPNNFRVVLPFVLLALRTGQYREGFGLLWTWVSRPVRRVPLVLDVWRCMALDWWDAHPRLKERAKWAAFVAAFPGFLLVELALFALMTVFLLWVVIGCALNSVQAQRAALLFEYHEGLEFRQFAESLGVSRWTAIPLLAVNRVDLLKLALQPAPVRRLVERLNQRWHAALRPFGNACGLHAAVCTLWLRLLREHWRSRKRYTDLHAELSSVVASRRLARRIDKEQPKADSGEWVNPLAPSYRPDTLLS